jgi:hypothetical protein
MNINDSIIISEINYEILYYEHQIFEPEYFKISPIWSNDENYAYNCMFCLNDYQLYLKSLIVSSDRGFPEINGILPETYSSEKGIQTVQYNNIMEPIKYTGSMIIATQVVKTYSVNSEIPCYSYKCVKEMVFSEGRLITAIDHSKAMLRIRKNLDMGLRSLDKKRDVKCIQHFIMTSFAGNYDGSEKRYRKLFKKVLHRKNYFEKMKIH